MIRGRGATPQTIDELVIDKPNLFGRRKLRVRYRKLKDWTPDELCTSTAILVYYFSELGAFQTIDDTALRVMIERLRAGMTPEKCRWSIDAKRDSLGETHEARVANRMYVASPQKFFSTEQCETWLDKSPKMGAAIAAANRAAAQRRAADPAVQADRKRKEDRQRNFYAEENRRLAVFRNLPREQQAELRRRGRAQLAAEGRPDTELELMRLIIWKLMLEGGGS